MANQFLHEHTDFRDLIRIVAQDNNIDPYLIEKDYWIMHCLWGLKESKLSFHLKGGTSLSKGFRCIHRFSEDIDIKIEPDESACGFKVYCGKNHDESRHVESRRKFYAWVCERLNGKIPGIETVVRDEAYDDKPDLRSGGIRLHYRSSFGASVGVKEGILLEVGFDRTAPNRPCDISSWVFDQVFGKLPIHDNRAVQVHCYEPRFTFVEKLQAVIKKFRQYRSGTAGTASLPANFIRHYYDLFYLLEREDVRDFIGTQEYEAFKRERFRSDDTKVSNSDALTLSDVNDRRVFEREYNRSLTLYYRERPSLQQILDRFSQHLDRL